MTAVISNMDSKLVIRRRGTPIPVASPRIPTPMPLNNNNGPRSNSKDEDPAAKNHPPSVGPDIPKLITKSPYKLLDNDVKTAWINPRLISKIDMEIIKKTDYVPPYERNMNGRRYAVGPSPLYQKQTTCGRVHDRGEWESPVNGRKPTTTTVPAPTLTSTDGKRKPKTTPATMELQQPLGRNNNGGKTQKSRLPLHHNNHRVAVKNGGAVADPQNQTKPRGGVGGGVASYQQSACYVAAGTSVYGVFAETKYVYAAVGGIPNAQQAQASAAAAFFARAAQKLNLSSSPHRRRRYNSDEADSGGFCGVLQRSPPPVPPALLRRIGVKEVTGVGKVKVMLRVSNPTNSTCMEPSSSNSFFTLDKRKKQVTLLDPTLYGSSSAPEDRRVGVAAPKMFAFDAIFSQDDSQTEVCSSALTDVIHAVINGTDGCLFCFGHAGLGKSYTMLGTPDSANTLGVIPCAISWLFKGINEQKQKTGARFSVRVSAVEVSGPTNQLRDLLAGYSNDSEQSPGLYLRDDPLFGNQPPHCELRVPTAEKAAHYLDAAVENRAPANRDSHLLFTLHVYQYSVAGKGGVAGGRSRLHLIDLGNSERGKASGGMPLSGVGNILLAIFNGQKHLPYKEHKLTHLLKDCLSSLTCHAAMIVHVSPFAQNYAETLTTVQLASRIHRMRRRKIKFVSTGTGNGSGGSSGEEAARTTGTSSEPDPSSSDLSADTVIYVGRTDDATDGEHPPVYIPSLNSGDNRCSMSKALRGSSAEQRPPRPALKGDDKSQSYRSSSSAKPCQSSKTSPAHAASPKSSPGKIPSAKPKPDALKHPPASGGSDEQWIDGPRISKSKVAEARHLMKEPCHIKKRETWVDGPMQAEGQAVAYGYMDSHKKNMIRKWVEHQTSQIQKTKHVHKHVKEAPKELTQFKSYEDDEEVVRPLNSKKSEVVEESVIRTGLKLASKNSDSVAECSTPEEAEEEEDEPEIPPALPLIQPLSSREVSLESLDMLLKERMMSNAEYNSYQGNNYQDDEDLLEIIEVEVPLEPVPTQDSCLQVTEEDIALCMGYAENPLPEVDQENPLDHPLRILSQENLTVVSTFTDSMSVYTDLERILPRHRYDRYGYDDYEDPDNPVPQNGNLDDTTRRKFDQLARLHELYTHRLAKANVANSETYQQQKHNQRMLTRCESLTLNDMLYGGRGDGHDNSSIYSEPAYVREKFCENCKVSMSRPSTAQNWYENPYLSASSQDLTSFRGRFQRHCHKKDANLAFLRHPDGASNPNLQESTRVPGNGAASLEKVVCESTNLITSQPVAPPNSLPSIERIHRVILSLETGTQKNEGYDSGHESTPRTSKHSPAAISRRAESGYDSVVRDSESSSIDSELSRTSHIHRRSKCKHKHEKSFCSWFLNPFTCKYIDEPPETHF
ncbi:LOW QUALITY PROTEIN: kinesin-like protein CG14535 [Cylas formicarius]|uniref:LOW QUALITY PROTEIN: kinesin-like protein CG14535 n=1 Tax=Cylas formicarius TaxID=197179 RepID=UPI0029586CF7|nr:LOW QUALITY PROTEIN: kinesin-like protein CG14535 [Cylas formicarius]